MNNNHDSGVENTLRKLIVESLDDSVEHLDASTLSRLNQARHNALAQAESPGLFNSQWFKAGTFVILLVTVINGWLFFSAPEVQQQMNTDDFELIIASEDFELMQDLDFVAWMIEQEHAS